MPNKPVSFIQSRGRARAENAAFIILQEEGNAKEEALIQKYSSYESEMKKYLEELPPDRFPERVVNDEEDLTRGLDKDALKGFEGKREFFSETTNARLNLAGAYAMVYQYCQQLPKDAYTCNKPQWNLEDPERDEAEEEEKEEEVHFPSTKEGSTPNTSLVIKDSEVMVTLDEHERSSVGEGEVREVITVISTDEEGKAGATKESSIEIKEEETIPRKRECPKAARRKVCRLTLPPTAPFRWVYGDPALDAKVARRSAALHCCRLLYLQGELNEWLRPTPAHQSTSLMDSGHSGDSGTAEGIKGRRKKKGKDRMKTDVYDRWYVSSSEDSSAEEEEKEEEKRKEEKDIKIDGEPSLSTVSTRSPGGKRSKKPWDPRRIKPERVREYIQPLPRALQALHTEGPIQCWGQRLDLINGRRSFTEHASSWSDPSSFIPVGEASCRLAPFILVSTHALGPLPDIFLERPAQEGAGMVKASISPAQSLILTEEELKQGKAYTLGLLSMVRRRQMRECQGMKGELGSEGLPYILIPASAPTGLAMSWDTVKEFLRGKEQEETMIEMAQDEEEDDQALSFDEKDLSNEKNLEKAGRLRRAQRKRRLRREQEQGMEYRRSISIWGELERLEHAKVRAKGARESTQATEALYTYRQKLRDGVVWEMRSRRGKRNDRKGGHAQRADTSEIEGGRQWLRRVRPKYCFQTIHYIRSIRDDLAPTKEDDELEDQEYLSESSEDEHGSVNPGEKRWWGEGTGRIRKRLDPRQPKLEVQEAFLALHDQVNQYAVQEQKETLAHWSKNLGEELHEPYQISPYIKSPAKAFLIPERTIQVLGLTASEHRSASLFPALLARMECLLRAKQVQATMDPMGTLKQLNGVLEALTTEAAGIRNYERLEFLGDGFLKLIATMHVFLSRPKDHEGRIHSARIPLVCNRKLFKLARRLNLGEQIISKPFLPRRWLPPGVTFEGKEEELRVTRVSLKDKQLADVMEAFLGAALRYGPKAGKQSDLDTGIRLAGRLGIRIPQMKAWSEWANQDGIPRRMEGTRLEEVEEVVMEESKEKALQNVKEKGPIVTMTPYLEGRLGYEMAVEKIGHSFQFPLLLLEALTHASCGVREMDHLLRAAERAEALTMLGTRKMSLGKQEDEDVSEEEGQIDNLDRVIPRRWYIPSMCYQRLESLGDAILDFLVVEYLIDRFPSLGAGELTVLKGACVSNEILGAICISVGLHQHIQHYSSPLAGDILEYTKRLEVHRRAFEEGADGGFEALGHIEYWREVKPPKVLADVVEAVFGAVFMDDQCRMQGVRGLFSRWILPMIEPIRLGNVRPPPLVGLERRLKALGCLGLRIKAQEVADERCSSKEGGDDNGAEVNQHKGITPQLASARGMVWIVKVRVHEEEVARCWASKREVAEWKAAKKAELWYQSWKASLQQEEGGKRCSCQIERERLEKEKREERERHVRREEEEKRASMEQHRRRGEKLAEEREKRAHSQTERTKEERRCKDLEGRQRKKQEERELTLMNTSRRIKGHDLEKAEVDSMEKVKLGEEKARKEGPRGNQGRGQDAWATPGGNATLEGRRNPQHEREGDELEYLFRDGLSTIKESSDLTPYIHKREKDQETMLFSQERGRGEGREDQLVEYLDYVDVPWIPEDLTDGTRSSKCAAYLPSPTIAKKESRDGPE